MDDRIDVTLGLPGRRPLAEWVPESPAPPESAPDALCETLEEDPALMRRRTALKVLAAAAAVPALGCQPGSPDGGDAEASMPPQPADNPLATGTPTDPDLIAPSVPWPMLLTDAELVTVAALADLIIPADDRSPSASSVGAHDFVNEWVSAPYEGQRRDLVLVRGGLTWLNSDSTSRFGREFAALTEGEQRQICDPISYLPEAPRELRAAARFFDKMRDLVSTAFWTTPEGMADLGYQGNVPLPSFDGPPREVLERLGLA